MTLEGPEGAGKTTQAALLIEHLRGAGHDVLPIREPGGTAVGERIRALLLDPRHAALTPRTEMLLFAASRAQLVAEVVRPALSAGRIVVCERYVDASLAYQGFARGLGVEVVRVVNEAATRGLRPDLTLLLDIDTETGLGRARADTGRARPGWDGGDRLEREAASFHARVREGFLTLARIEPHRIRVIDARASVDGVRREITRAVDRLLAERHGAGRIP